MNKVQLIGRLTKDPETYTGDGYSIVSFTVVTSEKWKDKNTGEIKESAEFNDCKANNKTGENIAKFFKKGEPIYIEGKLKTQKWQTKEGENRQAKYVQVFGFEFIPQNKKQEQYTAQYQNPTPPETENNEPDKLSF